MALPEGRPWLGQEGNSGRVSTNSTEPADDKMPLRWAVISLASTVAAGIVGVAAAVAAHSLGVAPAGMTAAATLAGVPTALRSAVRLNKIIGR